MTLLTAKYTDTLLHAEESFGIRNTIRFLATLADENGAILVDQTGAELIAFGLTPATLLHAGYTDDLIHAEDL